MDGILAIRFHHILKLREVGELIRSRALCDPSSDPYEYTVRQIANSTAHSLLQRETSQYRRDLFGVDPQNLRQVEQTKYHDSLREKLFQVYFAIMEKPADELVAITSFVDGAMCSVCHNGGGFHCLDRSRSEIEKKYLINAFGKRNLSIMTHPSGFEYLVGYIPSFVVKRADTSFKENALPARKHPRNPKLIVAQQFLRGFTIERF